jgi:hypothetical protein
VITGVVGSRHISCAVTGSITSISLAIFVLSPF